MLTTIIQENTYQDSVTLMVLSNHVSSLEGINKVSIMMGTPANLDIFKSTGFYTEELEAATPQDMCIVVDAETDQTEPLLKAIHDFLNNQTKQEGAGQAEVRSWKAALEELPGANLALLSIPGQYVEYETRKALNQGLNVHIFSDNVPVEVERELKQLADDKGLLVMGPDCGTASLAGIPLAFTNVVREGRVGIVGASGTGIQEVATLIDRLGGGVSHAIGTGGRDLSTEIGGISMKAGIRALADDATTDTIVVISKPPAKEVREEIEQLLQQVNKPVVAFFVGEHGLAPVNHVVYADTSEEAALLALGKSTQERNRTEVTSTGASRIIGLFSGGTLAAETADLMALSFGVEADSEHRDGFSFDYDGNVVIDLGDDVYTQGKPHPMIDPSTRIDFINRYCDTDESIVLLLDNVLGYGSHENMAGALLPTLTKLQATRPNVEIIVNVCGTEEDPQRYSAQKQLFEAAGILVAESNVAAVEYALRMIGTEVPQFEQKTVPSVEPSTQTIESSEAIQQLLRAPKVVNLGLRSFADAVISEGGHSVQYNWQPTAGGKPHLQRLLALMS
ncbi:protein fdrA [Exiguobacterium sp. S17]|nr:protein fdrA [Exiguobacterium sp. S17]